MDKELKSRFRVGDDLTLRTYTTQDAGAIFETVLQNSEHLQFMQWMSPDYSLESARQFVDRSIASFAKKESLSLGIFRADKLIGSIGFVNFDWEGRKTEIGYWLIKDEERKGIVTAASRILIQYAFDELEINRIEIRCAVDNRRSASVAERLGFRLEAILRQAELRHGKLHDYCIYGLLAEDPRLW
jgi:ribosomal-protein-serine acetyltransferase